MDWKSEEVRSYEVRLFPAVRISSERKAESRATAALCVIGAPARGARQDLSSFVEGADVVGVVGGRLAFLSDRKVGS